MLEDLEDLELIESELLAEQEDLSAIFYLEDLEEETTSALTVNGIKTSGRL